MVTYFFRSSANERQSGGAALNVALGARLELATQEAIAARGREAIIVYQWYSRCVKDPSLEDFESWLSKKISKTKEFSQLVQDWHNFYKSRGA